MPWMMKKDGEKACVYKKGSDGEPEGDALHCYTGEGAEEKCKDYMKALYANAEKAEMGRSGFSFTELQVNELKEPIGLKYIDGLAAHDGNPFTSMRGEEVEVKESELESYFEKSKAIIESTRTERGEIVGLPIDEDRHDHKGGAGWIVGLELDKDRKIIRFLVNWTQKGIDLIKGNIRRFFSPSIDPTNKLILGGSLSNWPATRDNSTGRLLLRPVELSQSIKEIDMEKTIDEIVAEKVAAELQKQHPAPAEPPAELDGASNPSIQELLQTPEAIEELGKKAQEMAQAAIRAGERKHKAVEFAARMIGGTREKPFGLRGIKPNELVAVLLGLPERQARAVEKVLEATLDSAIDFAQYGFDSDGFVQKPALPEPMLRLARQWVGAGKPIQEFFAQNPEVGDPDNFNLNEFIKKEE